MPNPSSLFPRGAEWVRVDFHLHTQADREFTYDGTDDQFRLDYIAALQKSGISLCVITNHNKFHAGEFQILRTYAASKNIILLPGVELSIGDGGKGVHTLIVFSDEWLKNGNDHINPFLTSVFEGKVPSQYEEENGRTTTSLIETFKKLESYDKDYFLVFAHVEDESGLWKELSGGRVTELAQNEIFKRRSLGFQKVRTHDGAGKDRPCRAKAQEWLKPWYPAEVEGSDPKSIGEIGKGRSCYAKLGELSYSSLKFALRDHVQRITHTLPEACTSPRFHSIEFTGGKLAGQKFPLSDELTTFIGSRGSGKSSVLECLRYGLGLDAGEADHKYKTGLISHMLANGAKLSISGAFGDGRVFEITRSLGIEPTIFIEGAEAQLKPTTLLPGLLYFGQKDLGNRQDGFEDELFAKLTKRRKIEEKSQEEKLLGEIKATADHYFAIRNADLKVGEYVEEEQKLKHQLAVYKDKGVEKQLLLQTTFDTDKRNLVEFVQQLEEFQFYLQGNPDEWDAVNTQWILLKSESLQTEDIILVGLKKDFSTVEDDYEALLGKLASLVGKAKVQLASVLEKEKSLQEEFLKLQRDIDAPGLNLQEFRNLTGRHEKLTKLIAAAKNQKTSSGQTLALLKSHGKALHELRSGWHREEHELIERTNETLPSSLKLEIEHQGNKEIFEQFLKEMVGGQGVRKTSLEKILETHPNGLALVEGANDLEEILGGTADVAKIKEAMRENLAGLVSLHVPDRRSILFNGIAIDDLSLGQRATALLQLLMSLENHPVFIIDQPEDDLDNETLFKEVVGPLLSRKKRSQFIIATHNPNIPVLGDAELVHACRETDIGKYEHDSGSLDASHTRQAIVSIMEGGARAFEQRQRIYSQWTNLPSEKNS